MNFRDFLKKLQGLPDESKKNILWVTAVIVVMIMGYFWLKEAASGAQQLTDAAKQIKITQIQNQVMPQINDIMQTVSQSIGNSLTQTATPSDKTPLSGSSIIPESTWKTFVNDANGKYFFTIKYPDKFTAKENTASIDFNPANISINISKTDLSVKDFIDSKYKPDEIKTDLLNGYSVFEFIIPGADANVYHTVFQKSSSILIDVTYISTANGDYMNDYQQMLSTLNIKNN